MFYLVLFFLWLILRYGGNKQGYGAKETQVFYVCTQHELDIVKKDGVIETQFGFCQRMISALLGVGCGVGGGVLFETTFCEQAMLWIWHPLLPPFSPNHGKSWGTMGLFGWCRELSSVEDSMCPTESKSFVWESIGIHFYFLFTLCCFALFSKARGISDIWCFAVPSNTI